MVWILVIDLLRLADLQDDGEGRRDEGDERVSGTSGRPAQTGPRLALPHHGPAAPGQGSRKQGILLEKGKIYLVEEMWWNHLDSTPH